MKNVIKLNELLLTNDLNNKELSILFHLKFYKKMIKKRYYKL